MVGDKVVCERWCVMTRRRRRRRRRRRTRRWDTESKTRTPHKDVGKTVLDFKKKVLSEKNAIFLERSQALSIKGLWRVKVFIYLSIHIYICIHVCIYVFGNICRKWDPVEGCLF